MLEDLLKIQSCVFRHFSKIIQQFWYYSTLKFTWKEFDTKLLDNFRKMLENATLYIWAGLRAFYIFLQNKWILFNGSRLTIVLALRFSKQLGRLFPENRWLLLPKSIRYRKFQDNFRAKFRWPYYLRTSAPTILLKLG